MTSEAAVMGIFAALCFIAALLLMLYYIEASWVANQRGGQESRPAPEPTKVDGPLQPPGAKQ